MPSAEGLLDSGFTRLFFCLLSYYSSKDGSSSGERGLDSLATAAWVLSKLDFLSSLVAMRSLCSFC